ncbi:MAG: glycosyltransferase family 61 protein [Verrucomicrobiae bacterium]|nr:glycosyltransferase family 61 protein [Verrucomicrobiae bacterium]
MTSAKHEDAAPGRAAVPLFTRLRLELRRFGALHKPLRWLHRVALPKVAHGLLEVVRVLIPRSVAWGLPRGTYSELARLEQGATEGRVVLKDQGSPRLPQPSIILLCGRQQHLEQPWPIFWTRHRHARLVGASLALLNDQKQLCVESVYGPRRAGADPAWWHFVRSRPVTLSGPWTSVVSKWFPLNANPPYAHWLLDALPRLAVLNEFPPETGILLPALKPRYQVETMQLLGLLDRCRWTEETHLLVEDYYFSPPTSMVVCYNPYAVQFLRATFLPRVSPAATPKKFFVRRTSYGRNMVNEAEVLQFFADLGWAIVDPAQMSFAGQIQHFAGAEAICAIHGSGTANMVWCRPGCKFLELFADAYLAGDQEWIAQCVEVDYEFLLFPSDHKLNALVDLRQVKSRLQAMGAL